MPRAMTHFCEIVLQQFEDKERVLICANECANITNKLDSDHTVGCVLVSDF
jgi:hypothetical protein